MKEKRQNGQCYFCPKPYSKELKCATKGGVFLMDLADGEEDPSVRSTTWRSPSMR
jgi:hypothetical protein